MKSMKFATGGDEAKVAAFGGALAESVLDDASAEERDDSGGDESDDGKPNEDDDSSEVEGAENSFEAKYEAILQLIFGSFNPIARSKSTKEDGDDFDEDYWNKMSIPDAAMHFLTSASSGTSPPDSPAQRSAWVQCWLHISFSQVCSH